MLSHLDDEKNGDQRVLLIPHTHVLMKVFFSDYKSNALFYKKILEHKIITKKTKRIYNCCPWQRSSVQTPFKYFSLGRAQPSAAVVRPILWCRGVSVGWQKVVPPCTIITEKQTSAFTDLFKVFATTKSAVHQFWPLIAEIT